LSIKNLLPILPLSPQIYKDPAECPAIDGGDEFGAEARWIQFPPRFLRCPAFQPGEIDSPTDYPVKAVREPN